MYYGNIKRLDIANGIGIRTSLFVSGCTNHCEQCFQPETWCFTYGKPFTEATEAQLIESLKPDYVRGITLLGGEPFEPENQRALLPFLQRLVRIHPDKDIWAYSGFKLDEELWHDGAYPRCEVTDELLSLIDVLVDGRFVNSLKDPSLQFRGSSNQRIIDMKQSLIDRNVILWQEE